MTMRDLETKIVQGGTELLKSHAERLAACGMTWRGPGVEVWQSEPERYSSEVRVTILKGGQIDDVLEFHIYDGGQPVVTAEEAMNWFKEQLEELESRRGKK
jgi:hypothetical protein